MSNLRSISSKVLDTLTMYLEQAELGGIVTRKHLNMDPYNATFNNFPAIWIGRGAESYEYETSQNVIVTLDVIVIAFIKNSISPEQAIDDLVCAIDNHLQRNLTIDSIAIEIKAASVGEPDYFDNKASVTMHYTVKYEYEAGER